MPEGHTIHRFAHQHAAMLGGYPVAVSSPQGRFDQGAALLDGRVLIEVEAYGKHLFYRFEGVPGPLHIHLGLIGKFWHHPLPVPDTTHQVRCRMAGPSDAVDLTGPMICTVIDPDRETAVRARLGADPLRADADPDAAFARLHRRRSPIGPALMDQSITPGVGNIFRAEVLFTHAIHPEMPCNELTPAQWAAIWDELMIFLQRGVELGAIVTLHPEDTGGVPLSEIPRGDGWYVYKQDHCRRCGTPVRRWNMAGRWVYACEHCQPRPGAAKRRASIKSNTN